MRVMAEKGGMHMSLKMNREDKVRLPRGNDASSIWLKHMRGLKPACKEHLSKKPPGPFPRPVSLFAVI